MSPPSTAAPELEALVGVAAYVELRTFGLIAAHTTDAPDLAAAQALAGVAGGVLARQDGLLTLAEARGADRLELMAPFTHVLDDFDARTVPGSWWEGLLKGAVGHGVAHDLCRLLARGLPEEDAGPVLAVLDQDAGDGVATGLLAAAAADDPVLAARLALWGRRVVGEALSLVQTLLDERPALAGLARSAAARAGHAGDLQAWALSSLTADHTRRMDRMRLAA